MLFVEVLSSDCHVCYRGGILTQKVRAIAVKALRHTIALIIMLSVGLAPVLTQHAMAGPSAGNSGVVTVAAAGEYGLHKSDATSHANHAGHQMPMVSDMSGMSEDCHHAKSSDEGQRSPNHECCKDGKFCAAALCLAKCFQLLAVLMPENVGRHVPFSHRLSLAADESPSWIFGPVPPPPRS